MNPYFGNIMLYGNRSNKMNKSIIQLLLQQIEPQAIEWLLNDRLFKEDHFESQEEIKMHHHRIEYWQTQIIGVVECLIRP